MTASKYTRNIDNSFANISSYAGDNHSISCPYGMKPKQFQEHIPQAEQTDWEMLQLTEQKVNCKSQDEKRRIVRNHFVIQAQKFHPDKNKVSNTKACTECMQVLNCAYTKLCQDIAFSDCGSDVIIHKGKTFQRINNHTVTCKHLESFTTYGYPDNATAWITKFKQLWDCNPTQIPKKSGCQFGDNSTSIYINIFDNGTVFVQGIMALQYAEEQIIHVIPTMTKLDHSQITTKKFSKPLKTNLAMFTDRETDQSKSKRLLNHSSAGEIQTYNSFSCHTPKNHGRADSEETEESTQRTTAKHGSASSKQNYNRPKTDEACND